MRSGLTVSGTGHCTLTLGWCLTAGFRLTYADTMDFFNESSPYTGYRFYDSIVSTCQG